MPKIDSLESKRYAPQPNNTKPLSRTPLDQSSIRPTTQKSAGKLGGLYPKTTGGTMNTGGKRRPDRRPGA